MSEEPAEYKVQTGNRVTVKGRKDLGIGEVLRVAENYGAYVADVVFDAESGRRLETLPIERLDLVPDIWERARKGDWDSPEDFLLKQLAFQMPLHNTGGQLSNSRTDLLPHQILLTRDVVRSDRRRFLIADEVGLGKTIEAGMIIRELVARNEAQRILIICPAGLIKNWQNELRDAFRLPFEVLGLDFNDYGPASWEMHNRVIASIDALKRPVRMDRLLAAPRWDMVIIDEAHHLSRTRYGTKIQATLNYKLADALRTHTRDYLFLSATPHQGDPFQFWSLVSLLDEHLFDSPESIAEHRGLLNRIMFRRTKREVTNSRGEPIFMRRQVQSQIFDQAARERLFYDRLTEYLREGYNAAGIGEKRTTSKQRAIGFVMATFQKIMSSSPRAIKQALRRRLMVLLMRHMLDLEQKRKKSSSGTLAEKILNLQDEIRALAEQIVETRRDLGDGSDADGLVNLIRQRVTRSMMEETSWALDGDEEGDEGIFADADIPDEAEKVRELIKLVPDGADRKFITLTRAIDDLRRQSKDERFVIFTQYLETLAFLRDELAKTYGLDQIAIIRGGPLDEKIAAVERFWSSDGARFLISTSAGGEGINLQVGRILFNYDLPWNPMAVEQRIGRIHRYGQQDTCQVYNLVARGTVEEQIYGILETKLGEIARTIGKIDPETGKPLEDFRSEVLGFLGSSPNYQALYMKALVDKDFKRTEREIEQALNNAKEACKTISSLTQDLTPFNLQDYLQIEGRVTLGDLKEWAEHGILRLGGSFLPHEEAFKVEVPEELQNIRGVSARYAAVTFDRQAAMRKKRVELMGIGHPLVDALLSYQQSSSFQGEVTCLPGSGSAGPALIIRALVTIEAEAKHAHREVKVIQIDKQGQVQILSDKWDLDLLRSGQFRPERLPSDSSRLPWASWRQSYETTIGALLAQARMKIDNPLSSRVQLLGLSIVF
ncbi:MAG: DEAD/DEAH box helicase [Lentisphaerae bacterium]|jgi:superfamily II DNA or RNA helicase|nr:DEAD/DEAH box helicase [Lentisphaerota bacterium]